jgi:hypothetical protein
MVLGADPAHGPPARAILPSPHRPQRCVRLPPRLDRREVERPGGRPSSGGEVFERRPEREIPARDQLGRGFVVGRGDELSLHSDGVGGPVDVHDHRVATPLPGDGAMGFTPSRQRAATPPATASPTLGVSFTSPTVPKASDSRPPRRCPKCRPTGHGSSSRHGCTDACPHEGKDEALRSWPSSPFAASQ